MFQLSEELLTCLACPACHGALARTGGGTGLKCVLCESRYPVDDWCIRFLNSDGISRISGWEEKELETRQKEADAYEDSQVRLKGGSFIRLQRDLILRSLRGIPDGPVLDLGCGTGQMISDWKSLGRAIVALDFSEESLRILAEKRFPNVYPVLANGAEIPIADGRISGVIIHVVLQHLPVETQVRVLSEAHRVLAPGGKVVVTVFNEAKFKAAGWPIEGTFPSGIPYHSTDWTALQNRAVQAGLKDVKVRPLGVFLFWQSLRIRGFTRFYRIFNGVLNALERGLQPLLRENRGYRSEYWIMSATKPEAGSSVAEAR